MTATELNLPPFPDTTVGQLGAVTFIGTQQPCSCSTAR